MIIFISVFYGCKNDDNYSPSKYTSNEMNKEDYLIASDTNKTLFRNEIKIDDSGGPLKLEFNWKRVGPFYESTFDHYKPVTGKILGICPPNQNILFSEFYSKYGFRGIFVDQNSYQIAIQAGFNPRYMRMTVGPNTSDYQFTINNFYVGTYYVDEPLDHDCFNSWRYPGIWNNYGLIFPAIKNYVHYKYGDSSKFIISGYRKCDHFLEAIFPYNGVDEVTFSSYKNWIKMQSTNECYYHLGQNDQRYTWLEWKNTFGNKFKAVFISANPEGDGDSDNDIGEYNSLLSFAHFIGNEAWLFCSVGGYNYTYIGEFCDAAWKQGWLRKFIKVREYFLWYKCMFNNPQLCDPNDPEVWEFSHKEYVSTFLQEVFP